MSALAELHTSDGTVLIQERRATPREPHAPVPAPPLTYSASPQMMALGGLTIIGVFVGSYTTRYDLVIGHAGGPLPVPAAGFLALQLFLARSAYRMFHDLGQFASLRAYARHRLSRYLPAVIPAVILGFALVELLGLPGVKVSASSLPANLTMTADMLGVPDIDASHWRLKIEIMLSVFVGLVGFGPLRRHLAPILAVGLALSTLWLDGEPARQSVLTLRGLVTADGYFPLFAYGIALHKLTEDRTSRLWWTIAAVALLLAVQSNTGWHGACVLGALVGLALIVAGHLRVLGQARWLVVLGELAFPIYVVHYVLGFVLIQRLETHGVHPVMAIVIASAAAILAGKIVHDLFERPEVMIQPASAWMGRALARHIAPRIHARIIAADRGGEARMAS